MGFVGGAGFATEVTTIDRATAKALSISVPVIAKIVAEDHSGGSTTIGKTLTVLAPTVSKAAVEDHSGGGTTASKTLTIPEPTVSGVAVVV